MAAGVCAEPVDLEMRVRGVDVDLGGEPLGDVRREVAVALRLRLEGVEGVDPVRPRRSNPWDALPRLPRIASSLLAMSFFGLQACLDRVRVGETELVGDPLLVET